MHHLSTKERKIDCNLTFSRVEKSSRFTSYANVFKGEMIFKLYCRSVPHAKILIPLLERTLARSSCTTLLHIRQSPSIYLTHGAHVNCQLSNAHRSRSFSRCRCSRTGPPWSTLGICEYLMMSRMQLVMERDLRRCLCRRSDDNGFVATRPRSAKKGKYNSSVKTMLPYRPIPK